MEEGNTNRSRLLGAGIVLQWARGPPVVEWYYPALRANETHIDASRDSLVSA